MKNLYQELSPQVSMKGSFTMTYRFYTECRLLVGCQQEKSINVNNILCKYICIYKERIGKDKWNLLFIAGDKVAFIEG